MNRKQEELGTHILENVRNELYYYFPYLDGAFACISGKARKRPEPSEQMENSSFFTGISAGTLCEKAGGSATRVFTYAAALPVSAPFPGKSGGQTFMEPGL